MSMGSYEVASLIFQVIEAGLYYKELEAKLQAEQAKGTGEAELKVMLRSWREEARQAALAAQPDPDVETRPG